MKKEQIKCGGIEKGVQAERFGLRMHYKKPRKVWSVDNSLLLTYHITEIELYKERKNDSKVLQLLNTLIALLVNMLKAKNKQMIAFSLGISYSPHSY